MSFNEEGFKNFQNYQSLVAANPGKNMLQLMDGFKAVPMEPAGNRNPNNPNSFVYQGYNAYKPSDPGGDQSQHGDTYGPGGSPVPNALGWDSSAFGDQAYWGPNETLPNGQLVSAHLDQLKNFNWPSYSSKPSGTSFFQDIMEGIKSPGIAPVLGAAGIGSFLGGAGAASGVTGSFSDLLTDIAAQDAAAGSSMFSSLGAGGAAGAGATTFPYQDFSNFTGTPLGEAGGSTLSNAATTGLPDFTGAQPTNAPQFGGATGTEGSGFNFGPPGSFTPPNATTENGLGSLVNGASLPSGLGEFLKTLPTELAKGLFTYLTNNKASGNFQDSANQVINANITSREPARQPYNTMLSQMLFNPASFFQTNPGYNALADDARAKLDANTSKFGNGGTTNAAYARDIMNSGAQMYDQELKNLLTASGMAFSNQGAGSGASQLLNNSAGTGSNTFQAFGTMLNNPAVQQAVNSAGSSIFNTVSSWFV